MKLTPIEEQVANIFMKRFNADKIEEMRVQLGIVSRSMLQRESALRGSVGNAMLAKRPINY
jgi:hypothetical protein